MHIWLTKRAKKSFSAVLSALLFSLFIAPMQGATGRTGEFVMARVKFGGGGDWYNDPSSDVNLLKFLDQTTTLKTRPEFTFVELNSDNVYSYPFLFLTGHGNVEFEQGEVRRLRSYLDNGGFLYIDDDYGLDKTIRREMKKVYPEKEFVLLPFEHDIFHCLYSFPQGAPKVHEHDDKRSQTYGLFSNGRLCVVYTFESNPSDGWADPEVHNDPPEVRRRALEFGANVVWYALTQ